MRNKPRTAILMTLALAAGLSACQGFVLTPADAPLTASGTISAATTRVSAEISGKIVTVNVSEGDTVTAGQELFRLDDQILQANREQANANLQVAQAALDAAKARLAGAQIQYDLACQATRQQDRQNRQDRWKASQPNDFNQPGWYFEKPETIAALQAEVAAAQKALDSEHSQLQDTLRQASTQDFITAEQRLAQARQAYQVAEDTLDQAKAANDNRELVDAAQKGMDAAQSELEAAQKDYDQMLSSSAAKEVIEARARAAVAQARRDHAQERLDELMTGDQSLQVAAAQNAIDQAKSAVSQAEAALAQAQAAVKVIDVQLAKTVVSAPVGGTVLSRPLNSGEMTTPGASVVEVGSLDSVTLTVYLPEDQYGSVQLNQKVKVQVDSAPGRQFTGTVSRVSDQAEFTPKNIQTVESRSTTVYAIEIMLENPDHVLKPGMPADATF